jgi:ketosteroid isomerase-like protein
LLIPHGHGKLALIVAGDAELVRGWFADVGWKLDAAGLTYWYENAWHDDISWRAIEGAPDDVGVMHGRDRLRAYFEEFQEAFDGIVFEPVEIVDVGEHVLVELRMSAQSRGGGVPTEITFAVLYTLRDGTVVRGREYASRDEALAAASLPPA